MTKRHSPEDYQAALMALLPPGLAWSKRHDSNLGRLFLSEADGLARLEAEAFRLIAEANPLTSLDAIEEWEAVCGLPDSCSGLGKTLDARRGSVLWKLRRPVGQSPAFFIGQAATLGQNIDVTEFDLLRAQTGCAGSRCYECPTGLLNGYQTKNSFVPARAAKSRAGERCYNMNYAGMNKQSAFHGWRFVWLAKAAPLFEKPARAGETAVGGRLRVWGNAELECRLNKIKPAHTYILFSYGGLTGESIWLARNIRAAQGRAGDRLRHAAPAAV